VSAGSIGIVESVRRSVPAVQPAQRIACDDTHLRPHVDYYAPGAFFPEARKSTRNVEGYPLRWEFLLVDGALSIAELEHTAAIFSFVPSVLPARVLPPSRINATHNTRAHVLPEHNTQTHHSHGFALIAQKRTSRLCH